MDLKELSIIQDNPNKHWYYSSKAKAISHLLTDIPPFSKILDVGSGSGYFSRHLIHTSNVSKAWCIDTNYKDESETHFKQATIHFIKSIESTNVDLVLMIDVIEHVENDIELIREYYNKVSEGTYFLISVPAFQFLWSEHDVFLEHNKRYSITELESVVIKSGLTIKHSSYYFAMVFPIALTIRIVNNIFKKLITSKPSSQLKKHSTLVNYSLKMMCYLELLFLKYNRFFGLTVFCLAQKPLKR